MNTKFVSCRICGEELALEASFGDMYVSDFISDSSEAVSGRLDIGKCTECGVVQLANNDVDLDFMYKDHYWYRSALNASMLSDLKDVVDSAEKFELSEGDVVLDIGTNDGSLFKFYSTPNLYKVGFDPAPNIIDVASSRCNFFENDYFTLDAYKHVGKKAKVITSIAMFYDLPYPLEFVSDISEVLDEDGVWIVQFTDLLSMLKVNAIDNICAEHLEYYRLFDVVSLVEPFGLEVFDVEYNNVNGGSIRIFIGFEGKHVVEDNVLSALIHEANYLLTDSIPKLTERIEVFSEKINKYLDETTGDVYGMAASTKGNTLLQLLKLDSKSIISIGEVNEDKFGLMTTGTLIPIVPEKEVLDAMPEVIIVLAWHFRKTFAKVLGKYIENGGTVLYPLPVPEVHTKTGVELL